MPTYQQAIDIIRISSSSISTSKSMTLLIAREKEMENIMLQDTASDKSTIIRYLLENVAEFRRLTELRQQGWKNPKGDEYFQKQRHNSDNADKDMSIIFYNMMKKIGREMHQATCALTIPETTSPTILDMCMAPGGFLATALDLNPRARALAFSLPISEGGHKALLLRSPNVTLRFLDITMLAADMGIEDIPAEHPEATKFLSRQLDPGQLFDIVLCDGQVLRTHNRAAYREIREAGRLSVTQLAIGLEHLKIGGTMVVLLHKVEARHTISLLYKFNKFSSVKLFKPTRDHAKRSSFYMIATNIQSQHHEAKLAVETWKKQWKVQTFGTDVEYEEELHMACLNEEEVLREFGAELIRLGRRVWEIQANALENAPFIKK